MDKNSIQYPDGKTQEDIKNVSMDLIGMDKKSGCATYIYSGNCFPFLWNDECSFLPKVGQYAQFFPLDHLLSKEGNFKRKILVQRFCFYKPSFYSDTFNALALYMNANLSALQYCDFPTHKATISQRNV